MSTADKGRFCNACQKQVIDFSGMDDRQVASFFKEATGSVCGRFRREQLNRAMDIPRPRASWIRYFFQLALPAFFSSTKQVAYGAAPVKPIDATSIHTFFSDTSAPVINKDKEPMNALVKGRVMNQAGEGITGASVMIKGTNKGVAADRDGYFTLQEQAGSKLTLLISSVGFERSEKDIIAGGEQPLSVYLVETEEMLAGEIIVVGMVKPGKVKAGPEPVKNEDRFFKGLRLFPNPVAAGGSISFGWEKMEEGYYLLQLLTNDGSMAHSTEFWIDKGASLMNIQLPVLLPGIYYAHISSRKNGKSHSEKLVIR